MFQEIHLERLKSIYNLGRNLSVTDIQKLVKSGSITTYKSGAYLVAFNQRCNDVFLILEGLLRIYAINDKGDEVTTGIRYENQIIASTDCIFFDSPSRFYYQALEDTTVLAIDYDTLHDIMDDNPKLSANRSRILQGILKETLERLDTFVLLTPAQRYMAFLEKHQNIKHRIPDKYIANILGITPVSLSRIRRRIIAKEKH